MRPSRHDEWLEADGLGGFASGTTSGVRTRRYHALLLCAARPPEDRFVLINGLDAFVEAGAARHALSSHAYAPDVTAPDGETRITDFRDEPWPTWTFALSPELEIVQEIFTPRGFQATVVTWRIIGSARGATLAVRPFLSGRNYHALHRENPAFRFDPEPRASTLVWHTYSGVPAISVSTNGRYEHEPDWYRQFLYEEERARGLDYLEDLATPGTFRFDLARPAVMILAAEGTTGRRIPDSADPESAANDLADAERTRRSAFSSRLHRSADVFLVNCRGGKTIVAGYPWFTDWGRDTFIALRGLCLSTGRLDAARDILVRWSSLLSQGMLPNRFPEGGDTPAYNSVDASLWFVVAVNDYLTAAASHASAHRLALAAAVEEILTAYSRGTRYRIGADSDGLLTCGEPGVQLTWMDAKVGDEVVTPRIGKPVEVQALWINALLIGAELSGPQASRWRKNAQLAQRTFRDRFWNQARSCLYDVVDVDHRAGTVDDSLRPNQIFAVGGLPFPALEGDDARAVVDRCEKHLLTPMGLRSLAPGERGYRGRYEGDVSARDHAYHQGTVWPWLMGPFVEAWIRVHGSTKDARKEARGRFVSPLLRHLDEAGLGHVSEIADGDAPHTPRGCPFQAWSLGELIRSDVKCD
jgi:predicted glycogen debranching enzyme